MVRPNLFADRHVVAKRGNPNMRKGAPSINPDGRAGKQVRTDGMVNAYSGHGTSDDARIYTRHVTRPVSEIQALDLRRGNWLAKRIVELRPSDCFRRGYELKLEDKDTAEHIMTRLEELCVNEKIVAAAQMENTVGGAALFPVLDGAVGDLGDPLDLDDDPRILGIRAIHLFESRELQPETWYDDITSPKFRRPKTYRVYALSGGGVVTRTPAVIHESRLAVFPGIQVSAETQPGQPWGWGDSKLTPVLDVIQDFGLAWGSAATILRNFSERVQAVAGLMKILAQKGGAEAVRENLRVLDLVRSTLRTRIVDAEANVAEQSKSVAGLSDMLVQFAQLVSAAAEEPMTRLFGMSPGGMNATGEYDQQMGHEQIATDQRIKYTAHVEWFARLVMLSAEGPTNGNEPDVWSVKWKPLRHPSEKEIAETRKVVADTDQIYEQMGLPAESILKDRFGGDGYSMETRFDEAAFTKQKKADEESAAAVQAAMQELDARGAPKPGVPPGEAEGEADAVAPPQGESNGATSPESASPAVTPPASPPEALNGAQVTSLVDVIKAAVAREIPRESAAAIMELAFTVAPDMANRLLGPSAWKPATPPAEATRTDDNVSDRYTALIAKLSPDGKCAGCDEVRTDLEVDHDGGGRAWDPASLSKEQRIARYTTEYESGVKLRALCRSCNASDGATRQHATRKDPEG